MLTVADDEVLIEKVTRYIPIGGTSALRHHFRYNHLPGSPEILDSNRPVMRGFEWFCRRNII